MKPALEESLLPALKKYFGYTSFRPHQEEIIQEILADRDVLALLPTGGGKSLCFQLPALLREGLTVVVSPLIALMKDQVDALRANGLPATFLNSSLDPEEIHRRLNALRAGKFKLMYVAPERLAMADFLTELRQLNVRFVVVDEAHCISEWGHDFRPEYRRLSTVRTHFPEATLLALTATATGRVRQDILTHMNLRNPKVVVASFNRSNLAYRVVHKAKPIHQLLAFLKERQTESGIIYCQSRAGTERVADALINAGINAAPYHAGLAPGVRARHQDQFLRDDVNVICATIAFGMGINKSNVRFVVHFDLPKNIEGYYQETGRAGRDGLASECLLLFSAGDAVKQRHFIDQKESPVEREHALKQLSQMVQYAESSVCRRKTLLGYFGEEMASDNCGGCDNCLTPRTQVDATVTAQKFLSCVYRIREKSGFTVGLPYVVRVLRGMPNEQIEKWGHDALSTYGIGRDLSRSAWADVGRNLVQLGLLVQSSDRFGVVDLTEKGWATLTKRLPILFTARATETAHTNHKEENSSANNDLFNRLRRLRKTYADQRHVPAYVIFSDATLKQMATRKPRTKAEFARISGVGDKKLAEWADVFLAEISRAE